MGRSSKTGARSSTISNHQELDMATKPANLFKGKESKKEESAEKKVGKAAYMRGEKREGEKPATSGKRKC